MIEMLYLASKGQKDQRKYFVIGSNDHHSGVG